MFSLASRNVNTAYPELCELVKLYGRVVDTRNGKALSLMSPLMLQITRPTERVLFDVARNANPFFHMMESIWMLAGREDVGFVSQFNKRMAEYSDNGRTFNAPYGHRWRKSFGYDQIEAVCSMLRTNPDDRRCVIGMWDPYNDLGLKSKDLPCNTQIMCRIVGGALDFTITNRSNDLIFGLMGANAVHMSILQEYMAQKIGVRVGSWHHMTNNLHVYEQHWHLLHNVEPYDSQYPASMPLTNIGEQFDLDCHDVCDNDLRMMSHPYMEHVVEPMYQAWVSWKSDLHEEALGICSEILSDDWRLACTAWVLRAMEKKNA